MAGLVGFLSDFFDAPPDGLLLVLTLLAGYPLGFLYRQFVYGKTPWIQHTYFIVCGFTLGYLNFGLNVLHSLISMLLTYGVILTCGGTKLSILLAFIINMTYLTVGYYKVVTIVYTVQWTIPQCMLTLRLIGLVFDIYDGRKKPQILSTEQKETALEKTPSLLETAGYIYFYGLFFVGPPLPLKRYQDFVNGVYSDHVTGGIPASVSSALARLASGLFYAGLFQLGSLYIPDSYLLSTSFQNSQLLTKLLTIAVWAKFGLYKYMMCWLIAEGTCILTGMTYNGKDENGNNLWDACANVNIRKFELASSCQDIISNFNINTNKWLGKYIFKRLKFLGNRPISLSITLFFLALWHGLYTGYFMTFFLEFFVMKCEQDLTRILQKVPALDTLKSSHTLKPVRWLLLNLYTQVTISYALVSFNLLVYDAWGEVYRQTYYLEHVIFCTWVVLYPLYRMVTRPAKKEKGN